MDSTTRGRFWTRWSSAAAVVLLAGACTLLIDADPEPGAELGEPSVFTPRIEAVVVPPFTRAEGVQINPDDMEFLRQRLREILERHPPLETFDEPPDELPGVATLRTEFTRYRVEEVGGDAFYLRTIDLGIRIAIEFQASEDEPLEIRKAYSYQKLYLPEQDVTALLFDLQTALIETAALVEIELFPGEPPDETTIEAALDPDTGEEMATPLLTKGNRFAGKGAVDQAIYYWELSLYAPEEESVPELYKLTRRTLNLLRGEGIAEETLEALTGLVDAPPVDFVDFRSAVRRALRAKIPEEAQIIKLSSIRLNHAHYSLAAAHLNLARAYRPRRQFDLAAYHFAMAFAHNPSEAALDGWGQVQAARNLVPGGLANRSAMRLYLSIPPPATARHLPGKFDEAVLPESTVRTEGIAARIRRIVGGENGGGGDLGPIEIEIEPVLLEPLESTVIESFSPEDLEPLEEDPEEFAVPEPPDVGALPPPEDIPLDVVPLEPEAQ